MTERIKAMIAAAESLLEDVHGQTPLLDAYLYESRVRCGRPNCRCMSSEHRHSRWCLSYMASGRSRTRTVGGEALPEVRTLCERYRVLRSRRRELLALVEEAVSELDRHIEAGAAAGWDRFEQLKARDRREGGRQAAGSND